MTIEWQGAMAEMCSDVRLQGAGCEMCIRQVGNICSPLAQSHLFPFPVPVQISQPHSVSLLQPQVLQLQKAR